MEWSEEYCGVQHLGEYSIRRMWVTVERFGTKARLLEWFPGCGFSPRETLYESVEVAKTAGEIIMKQWYN